MIRKLLFLLALAAPLPALAEQTAAVLFSARDFPSHQAPMPIGTYAKGCAAGLVELPETGATWQAMRLSRHRNFGHPVTIAFVQDLSTFAATLKGWNGLTSGTSEIRAAGQWIPAMPATKWVWMWTSGSCRPSG